MMDGDIDAERAMGRRFSITAAASILRVIMTLNFSKHVMFI